MPGNRLAESHCVWSEHYRSNISAGKDRQLEVPTKINIDTPCSSSAVHSDVWQTLAYAENCSLVQMHVRL